MSGPLSVFPAGYLGFFQIKNLGQNPNQLADFLQPSVELQDWLFASFAQPLSNDDNILVPNAGRGFRASTIVVPDSEMWWVDWCTLVATLVGGEQLQLTPAASFTGPAGASGYHLLSESYQPNVTGASETAVVAREFWLQPGTILGVFVANAVTAANIGVNVRVRGTRLAPL